MPKLRIYLNSEIDIENSGISRLFLSSRKYFLENRNENVVILAVSKIGTRRWREQFSRVFREVQKNGGKTEVLTFYLSKKIPAVPSFVTKCLQLRLQVWPLNIYNLEDIDLGLAHV